ncbi:MAG: hypothetical protein ACP5JH_00460 [Bacteroidota bacterium]
MRLSHIFCAVALIMWGAFYLRVAHAQNKPSSACCESGIDGAWCGSTTSYYIPSACTTEITIAVRQCVDKTRAGLLCYPYRGTRYCVDTDSPPGPGVYYPRYYYQLPIKVNPASLTFTAQYGGSNPSSQAFLILNGVSDLPFLRT